MRRATWFSISKLMIKWEEISEVGADVIVAQAETIGALAEALQMPAGTLENTIAYYNEYAQKGEDPLWMKRPAYTRPISQPPFYAVAATTLNGLFTYGGLKINTDAQVLSAMDDSPHFWVVFCGP